MRTLTVNKIIELKNEMERLLIRYGRFKREYYERPFTHLDDLTESQLKQLYDFLVVFCCDYYGEFYRIFRLPLEKGDDGFALWDGYFLGGKTHFVEMQMLKKQAFICREAWKACPRFRAITDITKDPNAQKEDQVESNNDLEDVEGISVESER